MFGSSKQHKQLCGFHLIELIITLVIISILTSISVPIYSHYIVQGNRLEAIVALGKLATAMERYYLQKGTYKHATFKTLGLSQFIKNNYRLKIESVAEDYKLIAIPINTQAERDTKCGTLTLAANGEKTISGSGKVRACW